MPEVGELVRDDPLELRRRRHAEQARRDRERCAALRPAAGGQRARVAVREEVQPRPRHAGTRRERSTAQCSAGASPGRSSRAPTIPITIRSAYQ